MKVSFGYIESKQKHIEKKSKMKKNEQFKTPPPSQSPTTTKREEFKICKH